MIVSRLRWHFVAYQPARGLEVEHGEHRFQERGVHPLALAGRLALDQGDQDALSQEDPGAEVGDGDTDPYRPLPRNTRDGHQAAHALSDLVDARAIPIGPALAEAGDTAVDQAGVDRAQGLVVDTQPLLHAGAVVLHDDIRILRELLEDRHALRVSEVERQAPLVTVQILEVEAMAVAAHAVACAPAGHFDFDRLRPPVDQLPHTRGAGPGACQVEDFEPGQRERLVGHSAGMVDLAFLTIQVFERASARNRAKHGETRAYTRPVWSPRFENSMTGYTEYEARSQRGSGPGIPARADRHQPGPRSLHVAAGAGDLLGA